LNPGLVVGPCYLNNPGLNYSKPLLLGEIPGIPKMMFPFVDVRDVAKAHYEALFKDGLQGQRIIISKEVLSYKQISQIF
jgi:dihydroflavonol-4-reductase